ncbi:Uncharacterised protein [Serratia proteamaculans]|uniref:hypothetical protein n=1 Tax=Serratia proteamaculans TaxID=28151 RepID=UPI0021839C37|nr:hypothetical protein [Serratia proteamaculans]CAI2429669.1 Uncharacterised protein [Serratia proteamaculans]
MEEEVIESLEEQANYHGHLDDGRDCTAWHVWRMRSKYRIRAGIIEPPPARPQVMPPQQPPKKKQAKSRRKKKEPISLD